MAWYVLEAKSISNFRKRCDKFLKAKATGNLNRMVQMQSSPQEVSQQLFARNGEVMPGEGALCNRSVPHGFVGGCVRQDTALQRWDQSSEGSPLV